MAALDNPNAPTGIPEQLRQLRWWPWETRALYERMRAEEADLMSDLIAGAPQLAIAVCYDVNTGPIGCDLGDCDPALKAVAAATTRCRIDALAWDGTNLILIELKPWALPQAIGQLLVYHCLLTIDDAVTGTVIPVLACRAAHAATLSCAARWDIPVAIIPPPPGQLQWSTAETP